MCDLSIFIENGCRVELYPIVSSRTVGSSGQSILKYSLQISKPGNWNEPTLTYEVETQAERSAVDYHLCAAAAALRLKPIKEY